MTASFNRQNLKKTVRRSAGDGDAGTDVPGDRHCGN